MTHTYDCADPVERERGIAAAVDAVRRGDLVVLPTDTVYGLGADAFSPSAVDGLLAAKRRGRDMPVPVLVGSWRTVDGLVLDVPAAARALIEAFWPGALTLVLEHAPSLAWDLGDAAGTVAVRMPLHPVALEVLNGTGPMAVSSANVSGEPPATTAAEAREQLDWLVEVYLEAGSCGDPVASTIVDVTGEVPRVLRHGAVDLAALREVVPDVQAGPAVPDGQAVRDGQAESGVQLESDEQAGPDARTGSDHAEPAGPAEPDGPAGPAARAEGRA